MATALLSNYMRKLSLASGRSNGPLPPSKPWLNWRSYSTATEEAIRNRFEKARPTNEEQQRTDASEILTPFQSRDPVSVEVPPETFRRNFNLPYVSKRLKQDKRLLQQARMQEREKYYQWGYLRHQYPESELGAVRKQFNKWKKAIHRLGSGRQSGGTQHNEDQGKWLYDLSDIALMREVWDATSIETRQQQWPGIMLATLRQCPSKASMVLEATLNPPPPGYAIHDVLRFIAQNLQLHRIKNIHDRNAMAGEVLALLAHVVEGVPKGHVPFQQNVLGLFVQRLPAAQAVDFYEILEKANYALHKNTRLQFASKLAGEVAHKNTAFKILRAMLEDGVTFNDAVSASTITTLLHCKAESDGWTQRVESFSAKDALQLFMEHGFTPNTITLTAVLDSLCQHGQTAEATRLALLFAESGVPLDAKTWTTVFAGAKASLNIDNVNRALMVARVTPVSFESVLSNTLHAVFYFADAEIRSKRIKAPWSIPLFRPMLKIYARRFELKSLQWWLPDSLPLLLSEEGVDKELDDKFRDRLENREWDFMHTILPVAENVFTAEGDAAEGKLQPNTAADAVMLRAYIRSLSRPQDILSFYKFFRSRLEEQSKYPSLMLQSQGSMIHDMFILVMTEHQELWREALHVFGDMLKHTLRNRSIAKADGDPHEPAEATGEVIEPDALAAAAGTASAEQVHPTPSAMTLTILLRGLLYQGESALAAQLMEVMAELDIEANLVTWNTLVRHEALAQNTLRTVMLLQEMEAVGVKPDINTYNAFNKLRDQDKALRMMQSIVDENRRIIAGGEGTSNPADA
ncbi:hypothetical protein ISF_05763 [Cordyceps fumosorosea ARSEF 2679]|uniref:Pentatricopeptide repeat protein n=1 Tax=Cordyceps fumosorosea (strain ARSEF 2679) TaxID=1081104 RepID=A0A167TLK7_CORFA|nr:hypothetical protein ISF_05763 [Cordyceps fumosorosea ARSEF 2679]OAA60724.1 hypothetical protein ISF_05763 [Cordyceps fumosorosea ARSEF 2679]